MTRRYYVGLDMGGTNVRTAAVSPRGGVLAMIRGPARAGAAAEDVAANIASQVRALIGLANSRGWGAPAGIGVAVPGPLDLTTGTVISAPHVSAWRSFPLKARLQKSLRRRVTLENDANAWALGEYWRGAARGRRDVVLIILGTGVGGGLIVGGEIVHGKLGAAGELGHIMVSPDGPPCDCGSRGCLEAYASASGLRALVAQRTRRQRRAMPAVFLDDEGAFSARRLYLAARAGNRAARWAFETAGQHLGIAIASFLNIFDPELVVIGGGVAKAMPLMRTQMMKQVRARALGYGFRPAPIVPAALGQRAGMIGAAYAAIRANL